MNKRLILLGLFIGLEGMEHVGVENRPIITIFIHGTHRTAHVLGYIPGVGQYVYHKNGLYKIDECTPNYCYRSIAEGISYNASSLFPRDNFYIFSWSGILSHSARVAAAYELHRDLNSLIKIYGKDCRINLITHSHGGNVALNLAQVKGNRHYSIENLILLAVPVQHFTKHHVEDEIFKNVFSLYSKWDLFQIGDPQGWGKDRERVRNLFTREGQKKVELCEEIPYFSQRKFSSKKVKHAEVRHAMWCGNRPIGHIEFLLPHFTQHIAIILEQVTKHDFEQLPDLIVTLEKVSVLKSLFNFIKASLNSNEKL
jgi:hypothetical protein